MMSWSFQPESKDHEFECRCNVRLHRDYVYFLLSDSVGKHARIHADPKATSKGVLPIACIHDLHLRPKPLNYAIPRYFKWLYN
jgi:hypothetical protein